MREYRNRKEAGERLATELAPIGLARPVVLALPRGGVPVALPDAEALGAPLDLVMVRKIGVPFNPEYAAGAVVDGPAHQIVFNDDVMRHLGLSQAQLQPEIDRQLALIAKRRALWLAGRAPIEIAGRDLVVVDDGIATGATVQAALAGLAGRGAASITLAVPVAPPETLDRLAPLVDRVVCPARPPHFMAVGAHYADFREVSDAEVMAGLQAASAENGTTRGGAT